MSSFAIAGLSVMAGYLILLTAKVLLSRHYVLNQDTSFRERRLAENQAAQFTIVQPILGGDPLLAATLQANLEQLPSRVTFLWLVDELDSLGQGATKPLAVTHPNVRILICPSAPPQVNPKTFKLQLALEHVTTEFYAVLDDDTTIREAALIAAVDALANVELYTGLPCYRPGKTFWANLVTQFVNNNTVLTYLPLLSFLPPVSINGMFFAFRTEPFRQIGGFSPILSELCDDYAVKKHVTQAGWRIRQGISEQTVGTSVAGGGQYFRLIQRWMVFALLLVNDQSWAVRGLLVLLLGVPPVLLLASVGLACANWWTLGGLGLLLVYRQGMLVAVQRLTFARWLPFHPLLSIMAELMQPLQTLGAICFPTIRWRNRRIRLRGGQQFEIMPGESN